MINEMNIVDPPDPPDDIPYLELEDFLNREILRANGISLTEAELISVLDDGNVVLAPAAAHTLGCDANQTAHPNLRHTMQSDDELLHVEAAYALARLGDDDGRTALAACLGQPIDAGISAPIAAGYLARLGNVAGYDVIVRGLKLDNTAVRMIACKQISCFVPHHGSKTPDGSVVDVYRLARTALADEDAGIQWQILVQLAWMGSMQAQKLLRSCREQSNNEELRSFAKRALDGAYGSGAHKEIPRTTQPTGADER